MRFTRAPYIAASVRPLAILEPDGVFALQLLGTIEAAGFHGTIFPDAARALPLLRERHFALALVDLAIVEPFALCGEASPFVPVIALSYAPHDEESCTRALDAGADDCICRSVGSRELVARIRNVLRRAEQPLSDRDQLTAVVSEMRIRLDDRVHNLTAGETAVLTALLDRAPRPMTVDEIARAIGANRGSVESRIKSLRKKLGAERLVSRGRFGYQLE